MATKKVTKKKICPICKKEKSITRGFYKSASPLYQDDKCVPICITCVKDRIVNSEDGTINKTKMKTMLQRLDKPLYWDDLDSAYNQYKKEHSYLSEDEIAKHGKDIIGLYFKNTMLRQNRDKSFADSELDGHIHTNSNIVAIDKNRIKKKYIEDENKTNFQNELNDEIPVKLPTKDTFEVTEDMVNLFGEGYTKTEYKKMFRKYEEMKQTYVIQTSIHREALVTYVRFKVKEEMATAKGDVAEAQKWYSAAQTAAEQGKLTAKQISKEDLQGGIINFSDIFAAVEGAKERIKIFPEFKYQPKDAADFIIWNYVNYERNLNNMPEVEYRDIYEFYDKKKKEYVDTYGDPYGIFKDDTTEENRETIEKFITVPKGFEGNE
ncbi:hypothetical protein [Eubacterium sp.]|uniref:hypothetical protein n=1 Tax=Eubacterium sp. TaxID=142586 RepID=UPI001D40B301|nr:hypothetical protein [Eubacterium sp.]MBS5619648.1 hypothetical protein [Eubacterium sp.]